jgi:hypothetical protein
MAPRTYSWRSKGYVRTRNGGGGGRRVSVWYVLLLVDEFTELNICMQCVLELTALLALGCALKGVDDVA